MRVLDLLRSQVSALVVREKLRQDQRTIKRGPEFVRHIGQEFGFVLVCLLNFFGSFFQKLLRGLKSVILFIQNIPLLLECLRLLFKLLIGLLEFRLLVFEISLGILQRERLYLKFLVRGLQFLLLGLKLFVEHLRFLKKVLNPGSVLPRTNGKCDSGRRTLQQFDDSRIGHSQEPKF